jgi:hypothetical protein
MSWKGVKGVVMSDSPHDPHLTELGDEIFEPTDQDHDPETVAQMQQGRSDIDPENALYDPWFEDARQAQSWTPGQAAD